MMPERRRLGKNCTPIRFEISNRQALRSQANAVEGLHQDFLEDFVVKNSLIFKAFWRWRDGIRLAPIPSA